MERKIRKRVLPSRRRRFTSDSRSTARREERSARGTVYPDGRRERWWKRGRIPRESRKTRRKIKTSGVESGRKDTAVSGKRDTLRRYGGGQEWLRNLHSDLLHTLCIVMLAVPHKMFTARKDNRARAAEWRSTSSFAHREFSRGARGSLIIYLRCSTTCLLLAFARPRRSRPREKVGARNARCSGRMQTNYGRKICIELYGLVEFVFSKDIEIGPLCVCPSAISHSKVFPFRADR